MARTTDVKPLRVLLADDHRLVLVGIRKALTAAPGFEVVGEAHDGAQVLPLIEQTKPDVVLLDIRMPRMDGLACLRLIRKRYPKVKVVMLSVFSDSKRIEEAMTNGACGYIVKSVNAGELPSAIRQAVEGTLLYPFGVPAADAGGGASTAGLTEREVAILRAVARGLSNQQIAEELWVTEQTVKFHLTNVYRKLGVANRTEAARYAYRHGLENPISDYAS
jgi:DNA-binding NarL/FixJ family response regulator